MKLQIHFDGRKILGVMLLGILAGCVRPSTGYTLEVVLEPHGPDYQKISVISAGILAPGREMSDGSTITVSLTDSDEKRHDLHLQSRGFEIMVLQDLPQAGLKAHDVLDKEGILRFMNSASVPGGGEIREGEAADIMQVIMAASLGPKRGIPQTRYLNVSSVHNSYKK